MIVRLSLAPSLLAAALAVAGCSKGDAPAGAAASTAAPTGTASAKAKAPAAPSGGALAGNAPIFQPKLATEQAPENYKVQFATTKGDFVVQVNRAWSPNGADRFYNLVKLGYYDGVRFHRVVDNFMVQFGIHPNPSVNGAWYNAFIQDDPASKSNKRGYITFATAGPNTRTTQVFINYSDKNARLDSMGFTPFGEVVGDGMKVVDALHKGYGELAPQGKGPNPFQMQREGDAYIEKNFPEIDRIKEAKIIADGEGSAPAKAK
ncbi:MAG TPA: peptidylprolyl isomerase [Candidatus Nanopelagicales bacterium]|nr:peptidylprolyl isomerase [Candidatus Nanopelagicales bacterium]